MIFALLLGCVSVTGGERITFTAEAISLAEADGPLTFDTTSGWTVTLTQATATVGPAYLWSGEPLVSLSPAKATDHDDFDYGYLRGEVVEQGVLDLLQPEPVDLGAADGIAGEVNSAELWLAPPTASNRAAAGGASFVIAGEAALDGVVVPFSGALSITEDLFTDDPSQTAALAMRVRGIPLTADLAEGGHLLIGVDPRTWVDRVNFAELDEGGVFTPNTSPWDLWYAALKQSGANGPYALSYTQP
jgi:hypothetical protein